MKVTPGPKPFGRYPLVSFLTCLLTFSAFILLLLVGLSLTIIKPIYLLIFRSTAQLAEPLSLATELRFGVWGVCATSALNQATIISNPGLCFGPQLGYEVPSYVSTAVGVSQSVIDAVQKALLVVLVLHPIAAGFAFVTFALSFFIFSNPVAILTLVFAIITAILTSVVFAIDLALVLVAKDQVSKLANLKFEVLFGNGVWMILASLILTWLAVISLSARACYCCGVRRDPSIQSTTTSDTERY